MFIVQVIFLLISMVLQQQEKLRTVPTDVQVDGTKEDGGIN